MADASTDGSIDNPFSLLLVSISFLLLILFLSIALLVRTTAKKRRQHHAQQSPEPRPHSASQDKQTKLDKASLAPPSSSPSPGLFSPHPHSPVYSLSLSSLQWTLTNTTGTVCVPAEVPGLVHLDLMRAGVIADPLHRFNEKEYRWVTMQDWTYSTSFSLPARALSEAKRVLLRFRGLDTVCSVFLNGSNVLNADNMFRQHDLDISGLVSPDSPAALSLVFRSAPAHAQAKSARYPYRLPCADTEHAFPGRNFIRKCQCDFGWDWGPGFASAGIWQEGSVELLRESGEQGERNRRTREERKGWGKRQL